MGVRVKKAVFYKHPRAMVQSNDIGRDTRIWAFSHIAKDVKIGKNCNIGESCYIESGVSIGNNVTIKNGVCLWDGVNIEDGVFIGPAAVFTNDIYPRSKIYRQRVKTLLKKGATIGANATILCGISIGRYAMVGAGAVVTRDVWNYCLVYGNPASLQGYVCECGRKLKTDKKSANCECGLWYHIEAKKVILRKR